MDWKACAVDDLRRYRLIKSGVLNCRQKINAISSAAEAGRAAIKKRGARRPDNIIIDAIVEVDRLKYNIRTAEAIIEIIERGLSALNDEERYVLEKFFMSSSPINFIELKRKLGYEPRTIYRLRDKALLKLTLAMYGVESV